METKTKLAQWLEDRLRVEHLSLRQAGMKTGLSHATISDIINGSRPYPETIERLARAFGGDCRLALEDNLFTMVGYHSDRMKEAQPWFLDMLPLLSAEHQHVVEVLVRELAKLEGIEVAASEKETNE